MCADLPKKVCSNRVWTSPESARKKKHIWPSRQPQGHSYIFNKNALNGHILSSFKTGDQFDFNLTARLVGGRYETTGRPLILCVRDGLIFYFFSIIFFFLSGYVGNLTCPKFQHLVRTPALAVLKKFREIPSGLGRSKFPKTWPDSDLSIWPAAGLEYTPHTQRWVGISMNLCVTLSKRETRWEVTRSAFFLPGQSRQCRILDGIPDKTKGAQIH